MAWPKGKPRGPRKANPAHLCKKCGKEIKQGEEALEMDDWHTDCWVAERDKAEPAPDFSYMQPSGPYTLWYDDGDGWAFKNFETLTDALSFPHRSADYVIMKPVQYRVVEEGAGQASFHWSRPQRDVPQPGENGLDIGPPEDPDNPDSGNARYV